MYNSTDVITLFTQNFLQLGEIIAFTIGTIVGACVALLGLGYGISKLAVYITGDQSVRFGDLYLASLPYKGYKRFHSKKWNMEHIP